MPVPAIAQVAAVEPCAQTAVTDALQSGDAPAVVAAFGGAESFREQVAAGAAPCVPLDDARWPWVVVNKQRPLVPIDYAPDAMGYPAAPAVSGRSLAAEAAGALDALVQAAAAEGAGRIALDSGFRSYQTQVSAYGSQVAMRGRDGADDVSARPGYSEHQTGLAADVVACDPGCGTLGEFGGTRQAEWTAQNAWRFGWIVRYEDGATGTTGYVAEPWHLRYVGVELATAYHEGGYHTLEEFFGLPSAATY
ncbi:D-alanyl-D-alanine carboxypeptidase family protein [Microbacterium sediminis]|nr:D-alanyl-D-alanine carboxypeptidase family protein [Microbacterium sediminis]